MILEKNIPSFLYNAEIFSLYPYDLLDYDYYLINMNK